MTQITQVTAKAAARLSAVQWDGSPEALSALQKLLAPGSPGCPPARDGDGNETHYRQMYIWTSVSGGTLGPYAMQPLNLGTWVTRDDTGRIETWTAEEFERRFTAVAGVQEIDLSALQSKSAAEFLGRLQLAVPSARAIAADPRD